jgi:hypothetical protein
MALPNTGSTGKTDGPWVIAVGDFKSVGENLVREVIATPSGPPAEHGKKTQRSSKENNEEEEAK